MKRGKVLNFKGCNNVLPFIFKNKALLLLTLFFIVGLIVGTVMLNKYTVISTFVSSYIENYIFLRTNGSFFSILFNSFGTSIIFLFICFVCGASIFGFAMLPLCVFARGFFYGSVTAMLYSVYSINGIAFNAVLLMPPALIFIAVVLVSAKESVKFSSVVGSLTVTTATPKNISHEFKQYCIRYLCFCIPLLLSALLDAVLSYYLIDGFKL